MGITTGSAPGPREAHRAPVRRLRSELAGDAVMALPAIADVRRALPEASLDVAARPAIAPLFSMVPGIDDVMV